MNETLWGCECIFPSFLVHGAAYYTASMPAATVTQLNMTWPTYGQLLNHTVHSYRMQHHIRISLQWRHNEPVCVSNHQPHDCLLNRLFRRRSKETSKRRVTGLCAGNSPGTGEFPAQRASNAENVSIWWRHHVMWCCRKQMMFLRLAEKLSVLLLRCVINRHIFHNTCTSVVILWNTYFSYSVAFDY